jgi:hypothetical protein
LQKIQKKREDAQIQPLPTMTVKTTFTPALLAFLKGKGYSHIHNIGNIDSDNNVYLLRPLKHGDGRLQYQETNQQIEPISDTDVAEMAAGDEFITFLIEIPSRWKNKIRSF